MRVSCMSLCVSVGHSMDSGQEAAGQKGVSRHLEQRHTLPTPRSSQQQCPVPSSRITHLLQMPAWVISLCVAYPPLVELRLRPAAAVVAGTAAGACRPGEEADAGGMLGLMPHSRIEAPGGSWLGSRILSTLSSSSWRKPLASSPSCSASFDG
jgi:hypothetical protein